MKCLLMEKGLWGFVKGTIVKPELQVLDVANGITATVVAKSKEEINQFELRSEQAYAKIALNVENDLQVHVASCNTAKEAWECLQKHFEFVSVMQIVRITRRFYAAKMEEGGDLMKHITEMTTLAEQLREMKEEVSSKRFAIVMLGSLPDSYDNFLTSMNARDAQQLDWESVKGVLVEEYLSRREKDDRKEADDALFTRGRGGRRGKPRGGRGGGQDGRGRFHPYKQGDDGPAREPFKGTCFACNQVGHKSWDPSCPKLQKQDEQAHFAHEGDIALLAYTVTSDDDDTYTQQSAVNNECEECHDLSIVTELEVRDELSPLSSCNDVVVVDSSASIVTEGDEVSDKLSLLSSCNVVVEATSSACETTVAHYSADGDELTFNNSCDDIVDTNFSDDDTVDVGEFALVSSCNDTDLRASKCDWYIDSGATNHMTYDVDILSDVVYHKQPTPVYLGDKSIVLSHATGKLRLTTACPNGTCLAMSKVLFVPKLVKNLLSVRAMTRLGAEVRFVWDKCLLVKDNKSIEIGSSLNGSLYIFNSSVARSPQSAYISSVPPPPPVVAPPVVAPPPESVVPSTLTLWHQRFGHLNLNDIKRLSRNDDVVIGMNVNKNVHFYDEQGCEPCALGKMHRLPFPKHSENRASRILEIVHTDLCGPMQVDSVGGSRYVLTFTDDYSRYNIVYFLKKKSEVLGKFQEYVKHVENMSNQSLKHLNIINTLRSDNGGEYTSGDFSKYCKEKGIIRQFTNPHSPQQNGVSERLNRTIMEGARSILFQAKLPLRFWAEAVSTIVYLRNRSPTTALKGNTPFEYWFKKKPDVSNLRVFGSVCYVHIPDACRKKLDPKAYKAVFVGYPEGTKGYKVYNIEKGTFHRSHSVLFHEGEFADLNINSLDNPSNNMIFPEDIDDGCSGSPDPQGGKGEEIHDQLENNIPAEGVNTAPDQGGELNVAPADQVGDAGNDIETAADVVTNDAPRDVPAVRSTYEETFMDQVAGLNGSRIRNRPPRLIEEETADIAFDTCCLASLLSDLDEPKSFKQASGGRYSKQWESAMNDEFKSLKTNQTWELVPRPSDQNVIGCRWVYKLKRGADGSIVKHKARLVAQGYSQTAGVDYEEVFAPVVHAATIRTLLSFANSNNFEVHQMDVKTAFLHGVLDCDLYMEQPEGYVDPDRPDFVCKLNKGLYGLKQAARCWNETLDKHLIDSGYVKGSADSCIYIKVQDKSFVIMAVYVDDIIPVSNDPSLLELEKKAICQRFEMVDNGAIEYFLGMFIRRDRENQILTISQPNYINEVLMRFGMSECKPVATPIEPGVKYEKLGDDEEPFDTQTYQQAIGCLTYISTSTRPDIAAAVGMLSKYMSKPGYVHWMGVKRVLRYLRGTYDYGLVFVGNSNDGLNAFSDSDWAGDVETRRSTSGYVMRFGNSTVSWCSRRQATVAKSSTEAEYVALSQATQEVVWLRRLLVDLGVVVNSPTTIREDNQGAIDLSRNPKHHNRTKHIDVSYHFTRERIVTKEIDVCHVPTGDNVADIMTKGLAKGPYEKFRKMLGVWRCS